MECLKSAVHFSGAVAAVAFLPPATIHTEITLGAFTGQKTCIVGTM